MVVYEIAFSFFLVLEKCTTNLNCITKEKKILYLTFGVSETLKSLLFDYKLFLAKKVNKTPQHL
jgi:hypothetical protein